MGEVMKKALILLLVLFCFFLATGCASNNTEKSVISNETGIQEPAGTPIEATTASVKETPAGEPTSTSAGTQNLEKTTEEQAGTESSNVAGTSGMKEYTLEELAQYNGQNGKTYVAYQGNVYDVSASSDLWKSGSHKGCIAGEDITGEIDKTPHGAAILKSYPVVGTLKQ
jgi:predicted heme/steroid binding protein